MRAAGTEPSYRLGQSIEHWIKKYGVNPPKDFAKWARICEHVVRHYNEGWADGFKLNITYWEIWNEPDWEFFTGMPEDYLDLLERTATIFRSRNPGVLLYPGGLTVANDPNDYRYKDSRPYFAGFKRLLDEGLIDTYSIHIHGLFDDYYFFDTLNEMTKQIEAAGLDMSGIYNTEAGLYETDQDLHARHHHGHQP